MDERPRVVTQVLITICASGSSFIMGFHLSWSNPMNLKLMSGDAGFPVNDSDIAWISALLALGAGLFVIPIGFLIDIIGAKMVLLLSFLPSFIGWALIIFAQNIYWLFVGRFILGIQTGACFIGIPIYVAEIAHRNIRGILLELVYISSCFGSIFVYIIGAYNNVFITSVYCGVCVVLIAIVSPLLKQTPVFLYSRKKEEAAIETLKYFRGNNYNIQEEIKDLIQNENEIEIRKQTPLMNALMQRATIKGLFISFGLFTFTQGVGFSILIFYSTKILKYSISNFDEYMGTILIGFVELFGTIIAAFLIDICGRRFLLISSTIVLSLSLYLLSFYFALLDNYPDVAKTVNWIPLTACCIHTIMMSIGFGPISWLMLGEIFSVNVKGIASSLGAAYNWIMLSVVAKVFVYMEMNFGFAWTFFWLGKIGIIAIIFVIFFVPETKGKTLNEILEELDKGKSKVTK